VKDKEEPIWQKTLLSETALIEDAIRNLDASAMQICLVSNATKQLVGTITDGDIRRGLLKGLQLSSSIESIIKREPIVVPPNFGKQTVLQFMRANLIHQLPVVAANGEVVGLHLLDDMMLLHKKKNMMVIMAGGQGTRLRPFTENCPKPLLEVGGKPMLQHIIERASAEGFCRFVLAVHYLGHMIEDYFGDGHKYNVEIEYLREENPLGTAGALGLIKDKPLEPFVVTNGDVLTAIHYGELLDFHRQQNATATMAIRLHEWQHQFGVVKTKGLEILGFEEKPIYRSNINAGIYVLEPESLALLNPHEHCDMPTLFNRLQLEKKRTIVYPMHESWVDVGRPSDFVAVNQERGVII
jgi:dTDP-glucose pyrophosphorylase